MSQKPPTKGGPNDVDKQIDQLRKCDYISEAEVKGLCQRAMEILMEESNVQRVDPPVIVKFNKKYNSQPTPALNKHAQSRSLC